MNVVRNYAIAIATSSDWLKNFASCTRDFSRAFEKVALFVFHRAVCSCCDWSLKLL